uniref:Reverse transcriptase Ty1/copia-type domain-containing protein n=1 Tax=Nelumbo nucifera TaxID=4432 RepID=A0A822YCD1_NELNU|nr:TPA_asm: hypothetical protein HUJ06_031585 [Nelumbo nucifera]
MGPTKTPSYSIFGSVCYVHVSKNNRSKLDPRARHCIFVGYDTCRKGRRCMDPETKKNIVSRDVVFDEVSSYESDAKEGKRSGILAPLFDDAASNEREINIHLPREDIQQAESYLDFCGFKSSNANPSLFVKKTSTICTMLLLYVDDMIIMGNNNTEMTRLRDDLSIRFEMKSLGEASCFLGLEVEESNDYFISQKGYAAGLLNRFGMGESKTMTTPMESCLKLTKNEGRPLKDATLFRQLCNKTCWKSSIPCTYQAY